MEEDEVAFITKLHAKESRGFMFGLNLMLAAVVLISFIVAMVYYIRFERTDIMLKAFLYALCISIMFFVIVSLLSYKRALLNVRKDLNEKTKIIESCLITEKKFMPLNNTFHFYINSTFKYSIEVDVVDFRRFEVNDEINIEYSTYSREYFGYF